MSMWRVTYLDNTIVDQKMGGQEISSEVINRGQVKTIALISNGGDVLVSLQIGVGNNFFYRRRTRITNTGMVIYHVLGRIVRGIVDGPVIFHPDEGDILYNNGFTNDHPWFYSVNFRQCELQ